MFYIIWNCYIYKTGTLYKCMHTYVGNVITYYYIYKVIIASKCSSSNICYTVWNIITCRSIVFRVFNEYTFIFVKQNAVLIT